MEFTLRVSMESDAFGYAYELARILLDLAEGELEYVEYGSRGSGTVRDENGNTVGEWEVK